MKNFINFEDAAVIALSYLSKADSHIMMVSFDKVRNFKRIIEMNLDEMNCQRNLPFKYFDESSFYFRGTNYTGEFYFILKPTVDIESAMHYIMGYLPHDINIASRKPNALKTIDLELLNGEFKIII